MVINAGSLTFQQLNDAIRKSQDQDIYIKNALGQRFIAAGLGGRNLTIDGVPGNALGAYLNGCNITVNGKPVKKILVNGKEYNSGDPYNIYVSRIVEEVEGEVPDGHNRVTTVTVNENGQVSITNKDEKAPANTSDK